MNDKEKHGDHCNCNACQHKREDAIESKKKEDMKGREFEILIGKLNEMLEHLESIDQHLYNIDQRDMKAGFD